MVFPPEILKSDQDPWFTPPPPAKRDDEDPPTFPHGSPPPCTNIVISVKIFPSQENLWVTCLFNHDNLNIRIKPFKEAEHDD